MDLKTVNKVIDSLGGTFAVARICDLAPQSISDWRRKGMPKAWSKYLSLKFPEAFKTKKDD